jgi:hypothetical protein
MIRNEIPICLCDTKREKPLWRTTYKNRKSGPPKNSDLEREQ